MTSSEPLTGLYTTGIISTSAYTTQTMIDFLKLLCLLSAAYFVVACIVFQFRHPWMTETEAFLNTHKALTFQTVRYQDLRPRDP